MSVRAPPTRSKARRIRTHEKQLGEADAPPPPRPLGRLDKAHPDRKGEQLRKWAPVFQAFAKKAEKDGGKVGVFIDYTALPQRSLATHAPGAEDDRTPEELATFKRAPAGCNRRGPGCSQRPGGWPQCAQPHTPGESLRYLVSRNAMSCPASDPQVRWRGSMPGMGTR